MTDETTEPLLQFFKCSHLPASLQAVRAAAMTAAVPTAPGYWMHETSGVLRPAVEAYLAGSMTPQQVAAMRAYLRQWIWAGVWDYNPHADLARKVWLTDMRNRTEDLTSYSAIKLWVDEVTPEGLDPI